MSYTVSFAPAAQDQIDVIEGYIALASGFRAVAVRYVEGIVGYCASLETFPERGMQRDDLLSGLRITNYRKHTVIAFRVNPRARIVQIVGVFHGGQDYEAAMSEPET